MTSADIFSSPQGVGGYFPIYRPLVLTPRKSFFAFIFLPFSYFFAVLLKISPFLLSFFKKKSFLSPLPHLQALHKPLPGANTECLM
jgi:hypothetical protein